MTHYLRYDGNTLVDCEATKDDISCVVCIDIYSKFLLLQHGRDIKQGSDTTRNKPTIAELKAIMDRDDYTVHLFPSGEITVSPSDQQREIIEDFDALQEIRGELFEVLENKGRNPNELVEERFRGIAEKYDLQYVTD